MKALIVYYSMSGNIRQTAQTVAERTGADLLELRPVRAYPDKGAKKFLWGGKSAVMGDKPELQPYSFDADKYDTIIIGSPVWASRFAPPLRTFAEDNRGALKGKRTAAFVSSMGGDKKSLKRLAELLGVDSFAAEMSLVEPLANPGGENAEKIDAFCRAVSQNND